MEVTSLHKIHEIQCKNDHIWVNHIKAKCAGADPGGAGFRSDHQGRVSDVTKSENWKLHESRKLKTDNDVNVLVFYIPGFPATVWISRHLNC